MWSYWKKFVIIQRLTSVSIVSRNTYTSALDHIVSDVLPKIFQHHTSSVG